MYLLVVINIRFTNNMRKYIVVVEYSHTSDASMEQIYDLICSIGQAEQLSEHAFLLVSKESAVFIRDAIKNSPYEVNRIFVANVGTPSAWRNLMADSLNIKELFHHEEAKE